jgi:tRNA A-37 threonylcarbamoyl transferase component Bud32
MAKRKKGQEEFEDTKLVIRFRKSKKNRQHNDQTKNEKRTNNDLQNITQKTKDLATRTPQITRSELRFSKG